MRQEATVYFVGRIDVVLEGDAADDVRAHIAVQDEIGHTGAVVDHVIDTRLGATRDDD